MKTLTLPPSCTVRIVSWDAAGHILDVTEHTSRIKYREGARLALANEQAVKRTLEVTSSDSRLNLKADLLSTVPEKCRNVQPSLQIDGCGPVSLDKFWDTLCESLAEIIAGNVAKPTDNTHEPSAF